jgi:phage host-nuclease inhibitor protein Gam
MPTPDDQSRDVEGCFHGGYHVWETDEDGDTLCQKCKAVYQEPTEEVPDSATAWSRWILAIDPDGALYDEITGDVFGIDLENVIAPDGSIVGVAAEVLAQFKLDQADIVDRENAERALEIRGQIESRINGHVARLKAITANIEAQIRNERSKISWWNWIYEAKLIGYARRCLKGKTKTAQFDYGKVSFRDVPASTQIIDMAAAVDWALKWEPEAVKVKQWTGIRAVLAAKDRVETEIGEPMILPFIVTGERRESVTIKTGV